jgi:hypothetical protein
VKVERVQMRNVEIPPPCSAPWLRRPSDFIAQGKFFRMTSAQHWVRHCEERSDEAIHTRGMSAGLRRFARNDSPSYESLRRVQMITEVGAEQNTMTIIMMPSEFVELARGFTRKMTEDAAGDGGGTWTGLAIT